MLEEQFIEINVDIQNKKQLLEDVQDEIAAAKKNLNVTNLSRHWLRLITVFFFIENRFGNTRENGFYQLFRKAV